MAAPARQEPATDEATFIAPSRSGAISDAAPPAPQSARTPDAATPSPSDAHKRLSEWRRESRESQMLPPGFEIGNRYRVIAFLGRGGMGAVYRVFDKDLDREVALKLIRPDLDDDPNVIDRFKREIQLSSIVTHRNVLRVYDLGESDGVKFLTMQYVEGEDLSNLVRDGGPMALNRAIGIFRQICAGLAAAHEQGVMHRDLKPENIMVATGDQVYVTDFGLARTSEHGLTATGAIMGTPDYMSPEQVRGDKIDLRSDIYSLGLIFYKLLTGDLPFHGNSAFHVMMERLQHPAANPRKLNPNIPENIAAVVNRCLALKVEDRYQSVAEILSDLSGESRPRRVTRRQIWIAAAVAIVLLTGLAALAVRQLGRKTPADAQSAAALKPVTILVADMMNRSGDPIFDETLEPILSIGLEGAPFVTSYNRAQARKTAEQLRPGAQLDEAVARLVGLREGVQVVISGALERDGNAFHLTTRAIDTASGRELGRADETASDREAVLKVTGTVAKKLRIVLGEAPSERLSRETFTAGSLAAAREYAAGQELQWSGKFDAAIARYAAAVKLDPTMGRAYAGMAAMYANLGEREQAEKYYKLAMQHIDRMMDREKYRTRGGYYLVVRNHEKAIEEYRELLRQYPADTAAINNLALSHFYRREMSGAMEAGRKPVSIYPKNVLYRNNLALYGMYAGDFDTGIREARNVLQINREFVKAYVALALSQAATDKPAEAEATYNQLRPISARGASFASFGLADLALMRGDTARASQVLLEGIKVDEKSGNTNAANRKRLMLAEAHLAAGRTKEATAEVTRATDSAEGEDILYPAGRILAATGDFSAADVLATKLAARLEPEPQVHAKLLRAEILLLQKKPREALTVLAEAQRIADTWMGRYLRGRAYNDLGAFTEASSDLELASKRRGEAVAVMLDDVPTARYLPPLYFELARAQEGLGSPAARGLYEKFLRARAAAGSDPLVIHARERAGAS